MARLCGSLSQWCPSATPGFALPRRLLPSPHNPPLRLRGRRLRVAAASHANRNQEFVVVGGGNSAGYAARAFTESGHADGKLCIVSKESVPPYERPALTKAYLFPLDKSPARLPGFHTCVGSGGERQTAEWYKEKGIEILYNTTVTSLDVSARTLTTASGESIKYGNLIIATGCTASRLPESIGGMLQGVHYIRDVSDADSLIESFKNAKKVVVIGGGYIGMEVAAATASWNLETTIVFPEPYVMSRLFTPSIAKNYEEFYQGNGIKFLKGLSVRKIIPGDNGRVTAVELSDGTILNTDTVIVGIGAKPVVAPFADAGIEMIEGGVAVDDQFRTSTPGIWAVGDVAAFPLKIYDRIARVEHVDHARKSAQHCVHALLQIHSDPYDYVPFFYSRVFEYPGSPRKIWWQFYGDNVGQTVELGNFDPKYATFWIDSGRIKGIFLESGSPEEFALLPQIARNQPCIELQKLQQASSVEDGLKIAQAALSNNPL